MRSFRPHRPIKPGTLASILKSVASHHRLTLQELTQEIWG